MDLPANHFLVKRPSKRNSNKEVFVAYKPTRAEIRNLSVIIKLKALYPNGVIACPSIRKLSQRIDCHYSVLQKAIDFMIDRNLMVWDTCNNTRAIRLLNIRKASEHTKYKHYLSYKFRRKEILNKTFEETFTFISEIVLQIHTSQQSFKASEAIDRASIADTSLVQSPAHAIRRKKLIKAYGDESDAIGKSSFLTIVSQRTIAKYLGVSIPTARKLANKMKNDKLSLFIPVEERIIPMKYAEYKEALKHGIITYRYYISNGWLCKRIGSCYYHINDSNKLKDGNTFKKMTINKAISTILRNREALNITDNNIKGLLYTIFRNTSMNNINNLYDQAL